MRAVIQGTGMYVPPNVVDNHHLSRIMDTSDEWISSRTGIRERRVCRPDQATSDLAVEAAHRWAAENGHPDILWPRDGWAHSNAHNVGYITAKKEPPAETEAPRRRRLEF